MQLNGDVSDRDLCALFRTQALWRAAQETPRLEVAEFWPLELSRLTEDQNAELKDWTPDKLIWDMQQKKHLGPVKDSPNVR